MIGLLIYLVMIVVVSTASNVWFATRSGRRNPDSDTGMSVLVGLFWPLSVPMITFGCIALGLTEVISILTNWLVNKWKL